MVTVRKGDAGFTLTEAMVVVVILSLLAAISTPLFTRDNNARKVRGWANAVAQTLQRARFQALGDRSSVHVLLYRTRIDMYREETPIPPSTTTTFTLLSSILGPVADGSTTVAIWDSLQTTVPTGQNTALQATPTEPVVGSPKHNEITFTATGSTLGFTSYRVFIRNELLPSNHPDASFVINVGGLTGYITSNDKVTLP